MFDQQLSGLTAGVSVPVHAYCHSVQVILKCHSFIHRHIHIRVAYKLHLVSVGMECLNDCSVCSFRRSEHNLLINEKISDDSSVQFMAT